MLEHSVVGAYKTLGDAEAAMRSLADGGFPIRKVSIVAKHMEDDRRIHGYIKPGDVAETAADAGACLGGIIGLLVGTAFVWVPGFGPLVVVGSLASMVLAGFEGAAAGATASGLLSWLVALGISHEKIHKYEEAVHAGKFLVIAHGPPDEVKKASEILAGSQAHQLDVHAPAAL